MNELAPVLGDFLITVRKYLGRATSERICFSLWSDGTVRHGGEHGSKSMSYLFTSHP